MGNPEKFTPILMRQLTHAFASQTRGSEAQDLRIDDQYHSTMISIVVLIVNAQILGFCPLCLTCKGVCKLPYLNGCEFLWVARIPRQASQR